MWSVATHRTDDPPCHVERSETSPRLAARMWEILRYAQDDKRGAQDGMKRASVDDPFLDKLVVLRRGQAQQRLEDVLVVLADLRRPAEPIRPLAVDQPRRAQGPSLPAVETFDLARERPRGQVLVGDDVGGGEGWRGRDAGRLERLGRLHR